VELKALTDRVQVLIGPVNVGLILLSNDRVAIIDTGLDRRYGKHVLDFLSDYRYKVDLILNTHSHADHIGGNAYIQNEVKCKIFGGEKESLICENPLIQAIALFGGCPFPELMNHMIMAEPFHSEPLLEQVFKIDDLEIQIIDLPGHSIDQKGFVVNDVAFVADSLFSQQTIIKHKLLYIYDPLEHVSTLKKLKKLNAKWFIGGHFPPLTNLDILLNENIRHIQEAFQTTKDLLSGPQPMDQIIKEFLGHFQLNKTGWEHFLYRATIHGYLSALKRRNEAEFKVINNLLVWYSTNQSADPLF